MTCMIQERRMRFFLTENGEWTSDINSAIEFSSVRDAIRFQREHHLTETADLLIFRERGVYRLEGDCMRPLVARLGDEPVLVPVG